MSGLSNLKRFLHTDPDDADCDQTFALLHIYVEQQLTHKNAADRYPAIARHLATCGPCSTDYDGLIALLA